MQTARETARFPFAGYPKGWFVVALSSDVPAQGVARLRYFGRDLIAYRGESGRAYVMDAYCPHLGAHLGHGGVVEGETMKCPFHGWRFDGTGRCVSIPYTDKIPPKARIDAWPVCEQDGVVHVFYDPRGEAPWALPKLDEEGWTPGRTVLWPGLKTHPQEVFENTVDMAHIGPVHAGRGATILRKEKDGERLQVDLEFQAPGDVVGMPDTLNDVHLSVTLRGLGWVVVQTHVRNVGVRARQRIYVTPVDEESVDIRGIVHVAETDDPAFTEELHGIFYGAYVEDFAKDFPIWENKRYLERPMLAQGDGPIPLYRRWCEQFYPRVSRPAAPAEVAEVPASSLLSAASMLRALGPMQEGARGMAKRVLSVLTSERPSAHAPSASRSSGSSNESSAPSGASAPGAVAETSAPGKAKIASVDEYFTTLEQRFVPSAAKGVDAVFQWELAGDGGGTFHAHVHDGRVEVKRGAHEGAAVCLAMSADDYVRIVNGELDGVAAFTSGRSKVKGSLTLAMKMRSLFPQ